MLASRPPLNCQKCQWRFFTDQGLERHLLGAHGLVTSNMQDMVNQNKDSGRCTICARVFNNKLVTHMNQVSLAKLCVHLETLSFCPRSDTQDQLEACSLILQVHSLLCHFQLVPIVRDPRLHGSQWLGQAWRRRCEPATATTS